MVDVEVGKQSPAGPTISQGVTFYRGRDQTDAPFGLHQDGSFDILNPNRVPLREDPQQQGPSRAQIVFSSNNEGGCGMPVSAGSAGSSVLLAWNGNTFLGIELRDKILDRDERGSPFGSD